MKRNESIEDYLESILMLSKSLKFVRSIDIVRDLGYSKPSVSIAMKKLISNEYIKIDDKGHIFLTDSGLDIASETLERHEIVSKLLISLGIPENTALKDACKIEHDLSRESFNAIKKYVKNMEG